jgi:hypothetical protein
MRGQVSQAYKTVSRIIVAPVCIVIFREQTI